MNIRNIKIELAGKDIDQQLVTELINQIEKVLKQKLDSKNIGYDITEDVTISSPLIPKCPQSPFPSNVPYCEIVPNNTTPLTNKVI